MVYRTATTPSIIIGGLLTVWCWILGSLLLAHAVAWPVSFTAYVAYVCGAGLAALGFCFAYWTYASFAMRYEFKGDTLYIELGPVKQAIPLADVVRIVPGHALPAPKVDGVNLWGLHVGRARLGEQNEAIVYSTHFRSEQLLYIVTKRHTYAISPEQPSRFTRALQTALPPAAERRAIARLPEPAIRNEVMKQAFWLDRRGQLLLAVGLALNLLLYGFLFAIFPGLPDNLHMAFPPEFAERLASKNELLELPLVALIILAASTALAVVLHTWERAAAYLVLTAAVGVQVLLWGASLASIA